MDLHKPKLLKLDCRFIKEVDKQGFELRGMLFF